MKLDSAYYRFVEHELYNHKNNLKELQELEEEIINSSCYQSGDRVQTSTLADETANKAIRLTSSMRIKQIQRTVNGIETGIRIIKADMEPKKYELLKMKYFDCQYTDMRIANELFISESTCYRWRTQIVHLIAMYLGLTDI